MRRAFAILLVLCSALLCAQVDTKPAFLDSRIEIRVALPTSRSTITANDFILWVGKQKIIPTSLRITEYAKRPTSPATPDKVVLPGSFAAALGGNVWDPNDDTTRMTQTSPEVYELALIIPGGDYEFKIARGGSWAENYGAGFKRDGQNIKLVVPKPERAVKFIADFNQGTFVDSINNPDKVATPTVAAGQVAGEPELKIQSVALTLPRALTNKELLEPMMLSNGTFEYQAVVLREVLSEPHFVYTKNDLGSTYSKKQTTFKVWSPVSTSARVALKLRNSPITVSVEMNRGSAGVWYATFNGDLHGAAYQYEFVSYGKRRFAADIYASAATQDSTQSIVMDMRRTDPAGWNRTPARLKRNPTNSIIYELHVRDFTINPSSGIKPEWRGKYRGMTQTGTKFKGLPTGIDYLKWLGITDVHILPFQNFNPDHSTNYNWGYETTLFNVPEEQYSTNPIDPITTIRETKQMILALHKAGLRAVQDVVYNHTVPTNGARSAFDSTVPYYYFRTNDAGELLNESGVGNALHDERPMARKFVRDSLLFWIKEYKLDGFRFDLIGMFTPESVKDWSDAVHAIRPDATFYGEPWTGGGPIRFGKGAQKGMRVGVFNDDFRNALRGELDGPAPGFIGTGQNVEAVKEGILGSINTFASHPGESINYVSAHDNLALNDKIALLNLSPQLQKRAQTLATATILLSQGIPFLEGGAEIGRTKGGNHNSYNAGDIANQFDWQRAFEFQDTAVITREFIRLRERIPEIRNAKAKSIEFTSAPKGVVAYRIHSVEGEFFVVLNGTLEHKFITLPTKASWQLVQTNLSASTPREFAKGTRSVAPLTATVLAMVSG